jgi:hypothetical protein
MSSEISARNRCTSVSINLTSLSFVWPMHKEPGLVRARQPLLKFGGLGDLPSGNAVVTLVP